jgi:hypothetical protein
VAGIGIQVTVAIWPFAGDLLGNVTLPGELWGLVVGGALLAWSLAEAISRVVWRPRAEGWA